MMNMVAAQKLLDGYTSRLRMAQASLQTLRQVNQQTTETEGLSWLDLSARREEATKAFREALAASLVVTGEMQSQARKLATRPLEVAALLLSNSALISAARNNLTLFNELELEERNRTEPDGDPIAEAIARFKSALDED